MGGIIGGLVSGVLGNNATKNATNAQVKTAQQDIAYQRETRDFIAGRAQPFYQSGTTANQAYNYLLGLGNAPTIGGTPAAITTNPANRGGQPTYTVNGQTFNNITEAQSYAAQNGTGGTAYQGFQATPGYQFQFDQGTAAVNALAGARGGLNSGATMQALQERGQGLANQEYNGYLNRLAGLSDQGLSAATLQANGASNAASGVSNALGNLGNAQAAGAIGQGNAWQNALGNVVGGFNYQKGLAGGGIGNSSMFNGLFGGKGLGGFV